MTKRVRFSPFLRAGVFAAGTILATSSSHANDVPFATQPPISTTADSAEAVASGDVDGDGDSDVVSASFLGDTIAWYENTNGAGGAWTPHTITTGADGARATVAADVDGDGDVDVVSASLVDDKVAWYENTDGSGTAWAPRTISVVANGATAVVAEDVDRDGDTDVVSGSLFDGTVAWYENTTGAGTAWTTHVITTQAVDPVSVAVGDVDGDGDPDALSASGFGNRVLWYENVNGAGTVWTPRTISTAVFNMSSVAAADMDADGDLDALASGEVPGVVWYENTAGNGTAWTAHGIQSLPAEVVVAADIDHDGDQDALSSSGAAVRWHENTAGNGTAWTNRTISTAGTGTGAVAAADVDGDGDIDALSAFSGNDRIAWDRNETIHGNACFVPQLVATTNVQPAVLAPGDVDGDGDLDAFVSDHGASGGVFPAVRWYENPGGTGGAWTARTLGTLFLAPGLAPADIDGDGDLDTFAGSYVDGLRWYRNDAGNGTVWTRILGGPGYHAAAGDVDGDGHVDAVASDVFSQSVWWHDNPGGGSGWQVHTITTVAGVAGGATAVADLDGDGDNDVLSTTILAENLAGDGSSWTIRTFPEFPSAMVTTDVDGDGDTDIVFTPQVLNGPTSWRENVAGNGTVWTTHTIAELPGAIAVADLDGDGDVDVARGSTGTPSLSWHENTAGNGSAWMSHDVSTTIGARGVSTGDVDGDGDIDILSTLRVSGSNDGRIDWFENRGGQVSLAAFDTAPAGAGNGEVVSMLRIDATHLGRAGDSPAELASLGLLFEEAAGDPLTSAEANALIENLLVYRDANGNGTFDPGVDVLVATVPTLALTNGIQTVTFADGDPNVQVALGTPRTYFVVTELTAIASGQVPNQFRVTHLGTGPSASAAEDRTYDIRLRLACPTDVPSGIRIITPVELIGFTVE